VNGGASHSTLEAKGFAALADALTHGLVNVLKSLQGDFRKVRCILGDLEGVRQRTLTAATLEDAHTSSLSPASRPTLDLKWDARLWSSVPPLMPQS
jgi:hypothetical protein